MNYEASLNRLRSYCAREERCVSDIRRKAANLGISPAFVRRIVEQLRKDGYINELRFSRAFCRGKFINNHWGKNKIISELRIRSIDVNTIEEAMKEIDPDDYIITFRRLLNTRLGEEKNFSYESKTKAARFLIQKGYEPDLVWKHLAISPDVD